ncbi:hypothetical protein COU74_01010 [Candidatus Peregrinibacteria bacterium CG10_big_fil_rev_8_21_14_0_10_36_19]|nr:MAG: hypothetical protein COU74_01010 [Candidatus Peregrinibacteria bacterium CG10_big_fil_rev_8_21_14_0_10_36_19]
MSLESAPQITENFSRKARYSRSFLEKNGLDYDLLMEKTKKSVGLEITQEDFENDSKLVDFVKQLQTALGFPDVENARGRDGMLGPYTLKKLIETSSNEERDELKDEIKSNQEIVNSGTEQNMKNIMEQYQGKYEIVRFSGNGNRTVAIYIPPNFDKSKPSEIIYHFHGTHSHLVGEKLPILDGGSKYYNSRAGKLSVGENRFTQAISTINNQVAKGERNTIIIYPLSAGRRGPVGSVGYKNGYDENWMSKDTGEDMQTLHDQTMAELSKLGYGSIKPSVTLTGHSAGGKALTNILLSGFKADKVKYLDASYGYWLNSGSKAADQNTIIEAYYRPNTETDQKGLNKIKYIKSSEEHGDFISKFI